MSQRFQDAKKDDGKNWIIPCETKGEGENQQYVFEITDNGRHNSDRRKPFKEGLPNSKDVNSAGKSKEREVRSGRCEETREDCMVSEEASIKQCIACCI